jgi:hypothetical protein
VIITTASVILNHPNALSSANQKKKPGNRSGEQYPGEDRKWWMRAFREALLNAGLNQSVSRPSLAVKDRLIVGPPTTNDTWVAWKGSTGVIQLQTTDSFVEVATQKCSG